MHEQLATLLLEWRKATSYAKEDDFLFASSRMKGLQPRLGSMISSDYIRPAAIRAGVIDESCPRFGAHNLRHGLATWLANQGTSVEVIQRMLRWSSARMLQRYLHMGKKAKKAQGKYLGQIMGKGVQPGVQ
jgi:integrase